MYTIEKPEPVVLRIISPTFRSRLVLRGQSSYLRYYYRCVFRKLNEARIFSVGQWLHDRIQEQPDYTGMDFMIVKNIVNGVPKYKITWHEPTQAGSAEEMDHWLNDENIAFPGLEF